MQEPPRQDGQGCPVRWYGRQAVVALPSQVGLSNAVAVADQLLSVLDRGAAVLIADMTATRSCDYAATDALARVYQRAQARDAELRLVSNVPLVRRVVALSGLGELVPVFSTLQSAQASQLPLAVVLPLHLKAAGDGFEQAAQQGMAGWYASEDTLTRVTDGMFCAGLTLQAALDDPADSLRQAAEHALELLDEMVREARDAAFARYRHAAGGVDNPATTGAAGRGGPAAGAGQDAVGRSREIRARARELIALSAAARSRAAAIMAQWDARTAR